MLTASHPIQRAIKPSPVPPVPHLPCESPRRASLGGQGSPAALTLCLPLFCSMVPVRVCVFRPAQLSDITAHVCAPSSLLTHTGGGSLRLPWCSYGWLQPGVGRVGRWGVQTPQASTSHKADHYHPSPPTHPHPPLPYVWLNVWLP